jgi:predicted transcriptional regulator
MMSPGTETVEQTIRTRRAFLAALRGGPQRKRELVDALETSRSTVDRAVGDLQAAGLARETDAGISITLAGRMATEIDGAYQRRIDELTAGLTPLAAVDGHIGIADGFLADARIEAVSPHVPDLIFDRFYDSVGDAPRLRTTVPTVLREHVVRFHDEMTTRAVEVDLVIDTRVVEALVADPETRRALEAVRDSAQIRVVATELPESFGVWETPTVAGVLIYTDSGPHAMLLNDAAAARRWARSVYEAAAAGATPIGALLGRGGD